jgi:hypothetical protein
MSLFFSTDVWMRRNKYEVPLGHIREYVQNGITENYKLEINTCQLKARIFHLEY